MSFDCGIVGLPNVGKSTIFNALTNAGAEAANYPFCTIEPNVGVVSVADERLAEIARLVGSAKILPTAVRFVDIAGLVKGASQGEGLGNQFLGHVRAVDAIVHVVRCFEDENVTHVSGKVSPLDDIEVINTELLLADLQSIEKRWLKVSKLAKSGDKQAKQEMEVFQHAKECLEAGKLLRTLEDSDGAIASLGLLTSKPTLYVANVSEEDLTEAAAGESVNNSGLDKLLDYAEKEGSKVCLLSGKVEAELSVLEEAEKKEFLLELGLSESGLDRLTHEAYKLLKLITFFTAGPKETRAWTCVDGTLAPQAAGKIHSDIEQGFIRAEVISYEDFVNAGGELGAKEKGLMRIEGKDYTMVDGDIVHFRFNK